MIKRDHHGSDARDEFTRRTLHGGVDQILASKTPINIEDLLVPEEGSSDPVRFILVEGPPGIGKSTFAWEVCRRWDEIESLRNYHTVVLLKLRERWVLNATKLSDIFRHPSDPELSAAIAKDLSETHGRSLLLVLDGFDEVSHSFHETSVIKSILCRGLMPECTVILTTRPSAKHTLRSVCQRRVDKHVEIIGFTEEERVRYITEAFSNEAELQVNFLKYMFLVPHIKSMMYIPLNCTIIAQVYYESQQSSHHLAIPRTRTQLYKALTHCLLVRHMKMKESSHEYSGMLPESLSKEYMEKFKALAEFAFVSYHTGIQQMPSYDYPWLKEKASIIRKVTFFKEDIPEGLADFGFMNKHSEMYASKGMEQTFSFLHLSLQEYLAAWHLAHSYSIEFQVAYHWLALDGSQPESMTLAFLSKPKISPIYKGNDVKEALIFLLLKPLAKSLMEPAVFLSGITGLRSQSEHDRNHWEMYLSHNTVGIENQKVLLCSLYEAQNEDILPHYFTFEAIRRYIPIDSSGGLTHFLNSGSHSSLSTPYDCYALSYCLAHSSDQFDLHIAIRSNDDVSLVETLVKGLEHHCTSTTPSVKRLTLELATASEEQSGKTMFWVMKAKFLPLVQNLFFEYVVVNSDLKLTFLQSLVKLQAFFTTQHLPLELPALPTSQLHTSLEWLAGLKFLNDLRVLAIVISSECSPPPAGLEWWPVSSTLTEVVMDINLPSNTPYDLHSSTDGMVDCMLKSVLRLTQITKLCLPNISRETMAGVHSILLHCPSLVSLELKRTKLGYDGILYICSALRNNTSLKHLLIHDDPQVPASRRRRQTMQIISFSSMERATLPDKTTCTDFLLELNNILKDNTTLYHMYIQSGLFLPLSFYKHNEPRQLTDLSHTPFGQEEYLQWTGLGPLQQFNVRAVGSGRSPNLRRSFSSSDLTQPQTLLFWDQIFLLLGQQYYYSSGSTVVDFTKLFSKKKEEGKKLFSLPSFTAPDTEVLQSFSGLDPRLKQCLGISQLYKKYVVGLRITYKAMMEEFSWYMRRH